MTSNAWAVRNGGSEVAPAGTVSAEFVAFPSKVEAGGELVAQVDDLVFDDGLPEPPANYQGLWWKSPAGAESGWGINFAHQGDVIFATWFTYDANGKPWWLAFVANRTGPGVYSGEIFTTTGPAFNAVPFNPANVIETTVGTATLTFADGNNGTFDYTVNGVSQTKPITRQVFAEPGTVCSPG